VKWTATNAMGMTPVIGLNGTVYFNAYDSINDMMEVCALNPATGNKIWSFDMNDVPHPYLAEISMNLVLDTNDTVYVGGLTNFYAITNGQAKWVFHYPNSNTNAFPNSDYGYDTSGFTRSTPALGRDGTLYINTDIGQLFAVNYTNGSLKWINRTPDSSLSAAGIFAEPPAIGFDGTVYFGVANYLLAVNPTNGNYKWVYTNIIGFDFRSPVIANNTVYVHSRNGSSGLYFLLAMNPDNGNIIWSNTLSYSGDWILSGSVSVASDGEIYTINQPYYESDPVSLISLAPDGTVNWTYPVNNFGFNSPLIGPDGTIYLLNFVEGDIYAFSGPSGIACAPWPEFQKNARRNGAAIATPSSLPMLNTNGFQFTISGTSNMPVCPCASSDLVTWTNLGQIVLTNSSTSFIDVSASNYPSRFYRAYAQ